MLIDFSKFTKSDYSKIFIKDEYGNKVFYAGGLSKGRIVPDKETYEKIIRGLEHQEKIFILSIAVVTSMLFWGTLFDTSSVLLTILLLGMWVIFFISHVLFVHTVIRNLKHAPSKLTSKDHLIIITCPPSFMIYFMFIALPMIFLICNYLRFDDLDLKILTPILLFITGLIVKIAHRKN